MINVSRRQFLGAAAASAVCLPRMAAAPLGLPIGFQVYPVRELLAKDFAGTLKMMAGLGYRSVEMCSPAGYEKAGFAPLVNLKASEIRETIAGAGLTCESCHFNLKELRERLDERIAFAKDLGLKQMILASFGLPETASLSDWSHAADDLNRIGERTKQAGIQTGFHNHHFEFKTIDGVLVYDQLMNRFDPALVKMQFQVSVVSLGYKAAVFMRKYPGRFLSMHLADWSESENKAAAVGSGVVDWKDLFVAAKTGGVKNYFVEMNLDLMKASVPYLNGMKG